MTSLYEIAASYRADAARLADLDLPAEVVTDTLDAMAGELEVKAQNVVMFARDLQATAAAIKDAEDQMAKRRKAIENRAKHLLEYVQGCMETAEVKKIECPHFRLAGLGLAGGRHQPGRLWRFRRGWSLRHRRVVVDHGHRANNLGVSFARSHHEPQHALILA